MNEQLQDLRLQIDTIDDQLLALLAKRMQVVGMVGQVKKENSIQPLQQDRWQRVLEDRTTKGRELRLSDTLIQSVWNAIHTEALHIEEAV